MDHRLRFVSLFTKNTGDYKLLMECAKGTNLEEDVHRLRDQMIDHSVHPIHLVAGMYVLEEHNKALCCVLCLKPRQLASIYVPKKERHKGNATTMLRKLVDLYRPLIKKWSCGFWCPVSSGVAELFVKSGWVAVTKKVAHDGTINYSPLWCKDLYMNDPSDYGLLIADTVRLNYSLIWTQHLPDCTMDHRAFRIF
jgi:hypothetical protein